MAQKNSLAWWEEEFEKIENSLDETREQIYLLEELIADIASDMKRFEKHIEKGPTQEEIRDSFKAMKAATKKILQESFVAAVAKALDITEPMLAHLVNMVSKNLNPTITTEADGTFRAVNLITDCSRDLGTAKDWFDIVEAVRKTGANSDAARMIGWRKLYDSAILGIVKKTNLRGSGVTKTGRPKRKKSSKWNNPEWLNTTYYSIIAAREGELNKTAGYWYFLEYGNQKRKSGGRYPYPKYGAPRAVSEAEREINRKGQELGVGITTYERKRTKGWHERRKILDAANRLVARLTEELKRIEREEALNQIASNIRRMITREIKLRFKEYHGLESLEKLEWEDLHRIRNKIIDRIADYQDYSTERILDPVLPTGIRTKAIRLDVEAYLQNTSFKDITIRGIFY